MKQFFNSANGGKQHRFVYLIAIATTLFLASCTRTELRDPHESHVVPDSFRNTLLNYTGLSSQTEWELQQARAATAKYRNIDKAIQDGYADISVVVPQMGHHYLKSTLVDGTFDIRKPEILVYEKHEDGSFELVAVEYAIPLTASANAPEGFSGSQDVWDENHTFGLWLLHAWVWSYNPLGVFNPTNPLVHTH